MPGGDAEVDWDQFFRELPTSESAESKNERTELFKRLDSNHNGKLKYSELEDGLCRLLSTSVEQQRHRLYPVRSAFSAACELVPDQQGKTAKDIKFKQFRMLLIYLQRYVDLWDLFKTFDASKSKRITLEEFKLAIPKLREWGFQGVDEVELDPRRAFRGIDKDDFGAVDIHEFVDWCVRHGLGDHADEEDDRPPSPKKAEEAGKEGHPGPPRVAEKEDTTDFQSAVSQEAASDGKQMGEAGLFAKLDANRDGFISVQEFENGLHSGVVDEGQLPLGQSPKLPPQGHFPGQGPLWRGAPGQMLPHGHFPGQSSPWRGAPGQLSPVQLSPGPWQGHPGYPPYGHAMPGQMMPGHMGPPGYPRQLQGGQLPTGQVRLPGHMPQVHMMPRPGMPGQMMRPAPGASEQMQVQALQATVSDLMNTVQTLQQTMASMPTQMASMVDKEDPGSPPIRKQRRRRPRAGEAASKGDKGSDVDSDASTVASWNLNDRPGPLIQSILKEDEAATLSILMNGDFQEMNVKDRDGRTALQLAAARGLLRLSSALLTNHFFTKVDAADVCRWNALHAAALNGHVLVCKVLLDHPRFNEMNAKDRVGDTALHMVASRGYDDICELLMGHPRFAKANSQNSYGWTALHSAAGAGHPSTCLGIINHRRFQKAESVNMFGSTALHCAARNGHSEVCNALLGHPDFTKALSQRDCVGRTALHWAALEERSEACTALVLHPRFFDVDATDRNGCVALDLARGGARRALLEAQTILEEKDQPRPGVQSFTMPNTFQHAYSFTPAYNVPPSADGMFSSALGGSPSGPYLRDHDMQSFGVHDAAIYKDGFAPDGDYYEDAKQPFGVHDAATYKDGFAPDGDYDEDLKW